MAEQHKVGNCKDSVGYCVALPPCNAVAAAAARENTGRKYLSRRPPGYRGAPRRRVWICQIKTLSGNKDTDKSDKSDKRDTLARLTRHQKPDGY